MLEITRRDFIKAGASGTVGLAFWPLFGGNPLEAGIMDSTKSYYGLFGIDEHDIQRTFAEALSTGGDYCDIFFQHRVRNELKLEDTIINSAAINVDHGVGIRVIKGDQTGYSFSEVITPAAMRKCAQTAASIANTTSSAKSVELHFCKCKEYYKTKLPWGGMGIKTKVDCLQKLNDEVFAADPRIEKCSIRYSDENNSIMVATSDGILRCDSQPLAMLSVFCVAQQNGRREEGYASFSRRLGGEFFEQAEVHQLAKQAVKNTVKLFEAVKPAGGEMEVVLAAGDMGMLLHEAIGHGMEADFNRKGESIFSDKIGKKVADKCISIVDDGTCQHARGAINIDDEANNSERTVLVHEGILHGYMHDCISSKHYAVRTSGNGRRESFRHTPIPRMRCTYMVNGPHSEEEIIKSVKHGVYAEQVGNGQVMIGAGDFTFYVVSGRLIENGKLTSVIKDVNIIGNGPEALRNMCMVGDNFKMASHSATCGKDGQWAPVSFGMPTVKISKLTVGSA